MAEVDTSLAKGFRIEFEGIVLPDPMFAIDHVGKLDSVAEDVSVWLWRFTVCQGVVKTERSERIIRMTDIAVAVINDRYPELLRVLPIGWANEQVIAAWRLGLQTMRDVAVQQSECSWTAVR